MLNQNVITEDNVKISFDLYKNNKRELLILAPGWCMTKNSNAFEKMGKSFLNYFDVCIFDFRGHGKSSGFYTFGAKEDKDLEAVVDYLKNEYDTIYLAGFSLGAMAGSILASKSDLIKKLILVSPPVSFGKIENKMWKKEAWGETIKKFELNRFMSIRPSLIPHKKIKPIDIIQNIKAPTLFLAGELDPTIYPWQTEELYKKARCKKSFNLFKNGIHAEDLYLHFEDDFMKICLDFLKRDF